MLIILSAIYRFCIGAVHLIFCVSFDNFKIWNRDNQSGMNEKVERIETRSGSSRSFVSTGPLCEWNSQKAD
jgi:hypothetical protein